MNPARVLHLLVALAALAGIAFSFAAGPPTPTPIGLRTLRFFSFFTISTNALVAWAAIGRALPPGRRWHDLAARPGIGTAISLYIFIVALIFHLLLADMVRPGLSGWLGNMLVHQAAPAGWLLCW
ncbi:MAG: Pr6Pr family membrane protein, partial [Rhizorhabdus sp.]